MVLFMVDGYLLFAIVHNRPPTTNKHLKPFPGVYSAVEPL